MIAEAYELKSRPGGERRVQPLVPAAEGGASDLDQDELIVRLPRNGSDMRGADEAQTLIRGARVYDRAGDIHRPPVRDVIVEGDRIASVAARTNLPTKSARSRRRRAAAPAPGSSKGAECC